VVGNDRGGGKEMVQSLGGRSFQRRGAVVDIARLENMRREVTGGRERLRQKDNRVERIGWMVKSPHRNTGRTNLLNRDQHALHLM